MCPEIVTTGDPRMPITRNMLPGEPDEAGRGMAANLPFAASTYVINGEFKNARRSLQRLGMGKDLAEKIVKAASKNIPGVGVRFETVFLQEGRVGGPREHRDFTLFRRGKT